MTNEEIQRVMEFIVKQQETFADNMTKVEERTANPERAFVSLFGLVADIGKAQKALTERTAELAEAQAHTDQRVNALIDIIEDRRRNGGFTDLRYDNRHRDAHHHRRPLAGLGRRLHVLRAGDGEG